MEGHGRSQSDLTGDSPYLDWDEAAYYLRTSRSTLQRLVKDGLVRVVSLTKSGRAQVFLRSDLDAYVRQCAEAS